MLLVPLALLFAAAPVQLTPAQRDGLRGELIDVYDASNGGFGAGEKSLEVAPIEAAAALSRAGDHRFDEMWFKTLDGSLKLLDAGGGGIYRAAANADWTSIKKEKPIAAQAEAVEAYSLGYALTKSPRYLAAAHAVASFLIQSLSTADGAFAAPDKGKAKPTRQAAAEARIDADENGLAIAALAELHDATGDREALEHALKAARWMLAHRGDPHGGFLPVDSAHPSSNLEMARACLALYRSTADRDWLTQAIKLARQLQGASARWQAGNLEGAAKLARFANLLARITGSEADRQLANQAFNAAVHASQGATPRALAELLLADLELSSEPLHMNIVGPKESPAARALFEAALTTPSRYARLEWWDPKEGPLPNPDVPLPKDGPPAAYACTNGICSLALKTPAKVAAAAFR